MGVGDRSLAEPQLSLWRLPPSAEGSWKWRMSLVKWSIRPQIGKKVSGLSLLVPGDAGQMVTQTVSTPMLALATSELLQVTPWVRAPGGRRRSAHSEHLSGHWRVCSECHSVHGIFHVSHCDHRVSFWLKIG